MTKLIYAIIPARKGSKGVPGKNIRLLNGHPLIAYSIAAAKLTPEISRTILSTDSEEYAEIGRRYGAETPFLRPDSISQDKSTDLEFINHSLEWFQDNEDRVPDYLVHLRPTTPLRDPKIISQAIKSLNQSPEATSLRSAHVCSESPYKWFKKNNDGFFTTLSGETALDSSNGARQDFPIVYVPDGYVDILKTDLIQKHGLLHGDHVLGFDGPQCTEIDTNEEFEYLEYILNKIQSPLMVYLNRKKS